MTGRKIYLAGQIGADEQTYNWREEIRSFFYSFNLSHVRKFEVRDPCDNEFSKRVLKMAKGDNKSFRGIASFDKLSGLLPPRDLSYVFWSDIGIVNLNQYIDRPFVGTLFELCAYYLNPTKSVVGIYNGDPMDDVQLCWHPFIRKSVDIWTKDYKEACEAVTTLF